MSHLNLEEAARKIEEEMMLHNKEEETKLAVTLPNSSKEKKKI